MAEPIMYRQDDAVKVIMANLDPSIGLTERMVDDIMDMKHLADDDDPDQTLRMCHKMGNPDLTIEQILAVFKAE